MAAGNPIVQTLSYQGWTIQVRKDGMIDATKGIALSPGFEEMIDVVSYICEQNRKQAVAEAFGKKAYDLEGGR